MPEEETPALGAPYLNLIEKVFNGDIKDGDIDTPSALHMAGHFATAVEKGLAAEVEQGFTYDAQDPKMLESLTKSVYRFSAAKSYQMNKDLTALLADGDNVQSFVRFRRAAIDRLGLYVGQWGEVEYNAAVSSSQMSAKWSRFLADKDIMPMLQFKTSKGEHVCPICAPYDDMIRPVDDPVWEYASPLLHYNCYCTILQLPGHAASTPEADLPDPDVIPKIFRTNYARKMQAFPPDHPYYKDVPKKSINAWAKENMP